MKNCFGQKTRHKRTGVLLIIILILVFFLDTYLFYTRYYEASYYDSSPRFEMARLLARENSILSKNWYYATELNVLGPQWINSILFHFSDDWRLIATISNLMHNLLLVSSYWVFSNVVFGPRKLNKLILVLLLLPVSWVWQTYLIEWSFYVPYIIIILLSIALFIKIKESLEWGKRKHFLIYSILQCALALLACMGGARHIVITYIPSFIAIIYTIWMKHMSKADPEMIQKWFVSMISVAVCCILGYFINRLILTRNYAVMDYGESRKWVGIQFERIETVINSMLINFGFIQDKGIFSFEGIVSAASMMMVGLFIGMILIFVKTKQQENITENETYIILFTLSTWVLNGLIILLTDVWNEPRYWLPQIILLVPAGWIFFNRIPWKLLKRICVVIICVWMALTGVKGYLNWAQTERNDPKLRLVVSQLRNEGYVQAYGSFNPGNVIPALADGKIDYCCIKDFETMEPQQWLMKNEALQHINTHSKSFIYLTQSEYDDYQNYPHIRKGEPHFEPGFVIITYQDDATMWESVIKRVPDEKENDGIDIERGKAYEGSGIYTIGDSSFGFIDSGFSANQYVFLAAWTPFDANVTIRFSNLNANDRNIRFQLVDATSGDILTSGEYIINYIYFRRP